MTTGVMSVAGGGAVVVVVMIADTMCMVIALAERQVVEWRMAVAADTQAAAVGMVAMAAGVEPRN